MSLPRPRRCLRLVVVALLTAGGLMFAGPLAGTAVAAPAAVANGTQFTDTAGNVVQAHGGGVLAVGGFYYWFGENRNPNGTFKAVSVYRSTDLRSWEFRNNVLTQSSAAELNVANIERPKVIFNSSTGQYVMWMHKENGSDYGQALAAVATSSTVDGAYSYRGSFRPLANMSRDITIFRDDNGTAYMASAARENADLNLYRLTPDYLGISGLVQTLWPGSFREAPALFKRNGVYFMLTSAATGWSPNQQKYATASSISGPWSALQNVGDGTASDSQTAYVLPVTGSGATSYLYLGDRWAGAWGGRVNDSRYVWLALRFGSNTSMSMAWSPQLTIDTAAGTIAPGAGGTSTLVARHSGKCLDVTSGSAGNGTAVKQFSCNGGANQRWQAVDAGGGFVSLLAGHSGKCLDVTNGSTSDGAVLEQFSCNAGTNQQFQLQDAGGGFVRLVVRQSGKCVDVTSASTSDGAAVKQFSCTAGTNQQWSRGT
ncbi:MAG TPA: RICIN domain-containing protein [Mycobacteriales bacterium]|nr:RICIN domain-containing protein [Mycobacteriales bacterium]